jgi:hypothetical protein
MTLQTSSAPTSGPRSRRAHKAGGVLLRSGDATVGPLDSASRQSVADRSPRKPVEIMAAGRRTRPCWPFSVLHEAVIVAAVWGYRLLACRSSGSRVTRCLFAMSLAQDSQTWKVTRR